MECFREKKNTKTHKQQANKPSTLLLASFLRILAGTSPSLSAVKLQTYLQFLSCFLLDTKYTTSPFFTERWSLSFDLKSSSTTKRSLLRCKQHECVSVGHAIGNTLTHHATPECMAPLLLTVHSHYVSFRGLYLKLALHSDFPLQGVFHAFAAS